MKCNCGEKLRMTTEQRTGHCEDCRLAESAARELLFAEMNENLGLIKRLPKYSGNLPHLGLQLGSR